jgi:hypothetical protein
VDAADGPALAQLSCLPAIENASFSLWSLLVKKKVLVKFSDLDEGRQRKVSLRFLNGGHSVGTFWLSEFVFTQARRSA